jgi:hypothetical protein
MLWAVKIDATARTKANGPLDFDNIMDYYSNPNRKKYAHI